MALTVNFPAKVEQQLISEAELRGISIDNYLLQIVKSNEEPPKMVVKNLETEQELLKKIKLDISEKEWNRYKALIKLRDKETLTENEHSELILLGEKIEAENVERLRNLVSLSKLRNVDLLQLIKDLGIKPIEV